MSVHEQFAEDLALYALGALDGKAKHRSRGTWQGAPRADANSNNCAEMPRCSRFQLPGQNRRRDRSQRLMDAIAKEPRARRPSHGVNLWAALGWAAAALMIVVAVTLWRQNQQLKSSNVKSVEFIERERLQLEKAKNVADILQAPDATRYDVLPVKYPAPPPSGKAIYSRERGLIFIASNLKPVPAQKAYELWLIPTPGAPIPAGVFKPDSHGSATVINPPLPAGVEAKAFRYHR